ncbi:MAG: response regulator transcription factor [Chloroflexi bacterium]|nr:response regulator transcription factor [Chloroflexota bacterium]
MLVVAVEPDAELSSVLLFVLEREGYDLLALSDGARVEAIVAERRPAALILDLGLPDRDGLALCRSVRAVSSLPIIALSQRHHVDDLVRALEAGADDYLVKPFHHREMLARLRALVRRAGLERPAPRRSALGDLALDGERREAVLGQRRVPLSRTEFRLLSYFVRRARRVVSATDLLRHVWERDEDDNPELVRVTVHRLRRKLAQLGPSVQTIRVLPGVGFIFEGAMDDAAAGERATAATGAPVRALFPLPPAVSDGV